MTNLPNPQAAGAATPTRPAQVVGQLRTSLDHMLDTVRGIARRRPLATAALLLSGGLASGAALQQGATSVELAHWQARSAQQQQKLDATQREINALAVRLSELQAQANRLNALGERLTREGGLADGEFDFDKTPGQGGGGASRDLGAAELRAAMAALAADFRASGSQLSVLESLQFNDRLERSALPSRAPVAHSYITSGFGGRVDPILGGSQFHKGIDFEANTGDPVLAVADGVVTFSGVRSGYGNVVEVDHGNGYVTRLAHNSRLEVQVGDLVRRGQEVAKAGSTGRSTGAHVHFEVWKDGAVVNPRQFLGEANGRG